MNDSDLRTLRSAVEDAALLLRRNAPPLLSPLLPVRDSLDGLCAVLRQSAQQAPAEDVRAAALVLARDVVRTALTELGQWPAKDAGALLLALASLHNRLVSTLEACSQAVVQA